MHQTIPSFRSMPKQFTSVFYQKSPLVEKHLFSSMLSYFWGIDISQDFLDLAHLEMSVLDWRLVMLGLLESL